VSRDSSVGIALGYGLDDRIRGFDSPAGAGNFSLHHRVQNGSGAQPAFYPMSTRSSFRGGRRPAREADHSPPSIAEITEWVELYLHYPNTPSWRGARLKHRDNFTFNFTLTFLLFTISIITSGFIKRGTTQVFQKKKKNYVISDIRNVRRCKSVDTV
jgi:hypothetical protein